MQLKYSHLFTCQVRNDYFADSLFRKFTFTVDSESAELARNLGLIIKTFPGGIHLFCADPELLKGFDEEKCLRFRLSCQDPYYINYTELSNDNPSNKVLYFDNLSQKIPSEGSTLYLHQAPFVGEADIYDVSHGNFLINNFNPDSNYTCRDRWERHVESSVKPIPNSTKAMLQMEPPQHGPISILADGAYIGKVYCDPNPNWRKPTGFLLLYLSEIHRSFSTHGKLDYRLQFRNRHTIWKYFLVHPKYQKYRNLTIISKAKKSLFNKPVKESLSENSEALVFESITPLPLSESYLEILQLFENYDPKELTGNLILKDLPHASPEQLFLKANQASNDPERSGNNATQSSNQFYSHIYV